MPGDLLVISISQNVLMTSEPEISCQVIPLINSQAAFLAIYQWYGVFIQVELIYAD